MSERYCRECRHVWSGTKIECCGQAAEDFDPAVHGASLVSSSNAWLSVEGCWDSHPLMREVNRELWDDGVYGAATHLRTFVDRLVELNAELQSELAALKARGDDADSA